MPDAPDGFTCDNAELAETAKINFENVVAEVPSLAVHPIFKFAMAQLDALVTRLSETEPKAPPTTPTEEQVEDRAREFYEASRKRVGGRPSWELLNRNDPYDMEMRNHAITTARKALAESK